MPIWLGSSKIGQIYLGSSKIGKIYLGSQLVYQSLINLYDGGQTAASGSWGYKRNSTGTGATFSFGTKIKISGSNYGNSFYGTLLYPTNKISVSPGRTLKFTLSSTDSNPLLVTFRGTAIAAGTTWYGKIAVVYLTSAPGTFSSTFDIDTWVTSQSYKDVVIHKYGQYNDSTSKTITQQEYTSTVPDGLTSGKYYPCLVIYGYDSGFTSNLAIDKIQLV